MSIQISLVMLTGAFGLATSPASAKLSYTIHQIESGTTFVMVSGAFEFSDDLARFRDLVAREHPAFVGFDSPGGNVVKAMELGRAIRSAGLATVQVRRAECASACSLSFLGGTARYAEPGSLGVHKSSFNDTRGMEVGDAVSAVQQTTAEIIVYMSEMGVDPGLLQLSLAYDSNDIRYLSGSEMSKFKVTTTGATPLSAANAATDPSPSSEQPPLGVQAKAARSLDIPLARNGIVRHPKGMAPLKTTRDAGTGIATEVINGAVIQILEVRGDWYHVETAGRRGYMHYSWVRVAQFEENTGDVRYVQVRSFSTLPEAEAFVTNSSVPLEVHLAANGWFAVTLKDMYAEQEAKDVSSALKARGLIAKDSMVTLGNTYVRRVCCE